MKKQKIRNQVIKEVMSVAAGPNRNARVDLVLARHLLAADETQLKAVCRQIGGEAKYW